MVKFASLASRIISFAGNGMLNHLVTKKGIDELIPVQPGLVAKITKVEDFSIDLSVALRTLLSWSRDYKRDVEVRQTILKQAQAGDEAIIEQVVMNMILKNKVAWGVSKTLSETSSQPLSLN